MRPTTMRKARTSSWIQMEPDLSLVWLLGGQIGIARFGPGWTFFHIP